MNFQEVMSNIADVSDQLRANAVEAERIGRLPDESEKLIKSTGVTRMLQPKEWGGMEANPVEFLEAVGEVAKSRCSASAWVAGVVGLHPFEVGVMDRRAQEDVWGEDPSVWIASPYVAQGRAKPVDGGFQLSGHWTFSSGSENAHWFHLGGLIVDETGEPVSADHHFLIPRADVEIVEGTWDVAGLSGTGSKDLIIRDAFVPDYRVLEFQTVVDGTAARSQGRTEPLYGMPWFVLFGNAVSATVVGICEALLSEVVEYQAGRTNVFGEAVKADPYVLPGIGEAASEIAASRLQILHNVDAVYQVLARGEELTTTQRAHVRRDQVRASWRAVAAADSLFGAAGGSAMRHSNPAQRLWRDAHAGLNHAVNMQGKAYQTSALALMGVVPDPVLL